LIRSSHFDASNSRQTCGSPREVATRDGVRNVVEYANIGQSVFSEDGGHFYAGGGFTVAIGR
jgi:hypothetical protein